MIGTTLAFSGCAGVPLAPGGTATRHSNDYGDDDDGWLFNRLLGRKNTPDPAAAPPADSGVRQASAIEPLPAINDAKSAQEAAAAKGRPPC